MTSLREPTEPGAKNARALRVLSLETSPSDTELLHANMTEGGIACEMVSVQTGADFVTALEEGSFDLVLAGYPVPSIDSISALELAREAWPDVPFIVVSGTAGEEVAIETLKRGATDYVLKHRLERLVPAVRRAIRESEERRDRAEKALRRSEQQFRTLVEQIPVATYIQQTVESGKTAETRPTVYASPQIEALSGFPPRAFVEDPELWIKLLHPEDRERVLIEDRLTDESGEPFSVEYRQITRDGRLVWIRDEAVLVRSEVGYPHFWQGVMYDITDRKRAEEALKESEQRFRAIFEQASVGIAQVDLDGAWLRVNDKLCEITGYSREEITRVDFRDILVPEDLTRDLERRVRMLEGEYRHYSEEKRIRRKDGSLRWVYLAVTLIHSSGEPESFVGIIEDITERKRVEKKLGESEERFRATFEQAAVGVAHSAPDGTWLRVNQRLCDIVGYTHEELLRKTFQDITHPDDLEADLAQTRRLLAGEIETFSMEKRYIRKDGSLVWINLTVSLVREASGDPGYFITVVEDITERKRADQELKESEGRFRSTFENAPIGMALVSLDNHHLDVNRALCDMLGYSEEELLSRSTLEISHPDDRKASTARVQALLEGTINRELLEKRYICADGRVVWALSSVSLVRDSQGEPAYFVSQYQDITERKRAEEALKESEERFRLLAENAQDIVYRYRLKPTPGFEYVSPSVTALTGYTPTEHYADPRLGLKMVHPDDAHLLRELTRSAESLTVRWLRKHGGVISTEHSNKPVYDESGNVVAIEGIARDVTEREHAAQSLRRSLTVLLALREAGQVLNSTLSSEEIVSSLLEIMRSVSDLTTVLISIPDQDGELRIWRSTGLEGLQPKARFVREAEAARLATLADDEPHLFQLHRSGSEGNHPVGLCLPLRVKDNVVGVLEAYGRESLADSDTVEVLSSLASQAASALENARLYEELGVRERALQDLVGKLLRAQEEEHRRIAYEVHDGLAQIAVAAHQRLQAFARRHSPSTDREQKDLERILKLVRATVSDARRIIANLRPTTLDDLGLTTTLSLAVERLREDGYEVDYEQSLGDERLPEAVEIALFRISQEALTNVRKHAQTKMVRIRLIRSRYEARLEVRDYGRGFDPDQASAGSGPGERVGLAGMRERVAMLGGTLTIRSEPDAGTSVVARVPLNAMTVTASSEQDGSDDAV